MKKIYLATLIIGLVVFAAISYFLYVAYFGNRADIKQETRKYSLDLIATHEKPQDCWFAVEGKVYDVTKYIAAQRHPGGAAILEGCGKDATALFNTRPMGSGTPHSESAREGLKNFIIGDLQ